MLLKIVGKSVKLTGKLAFTRLGVLAIGAGAMYLADPDRGRSRRTELRARAEGMARGQIRQVSKRARAASAI